MRWNTTLVAPPGQSRLIKIVDGLTTLVLEYARRSHLRMSVTWVTVAMILRKRGLIYQEQLMAFLDTADCNELENRGDDAT